MKNRTTNSQASPLLRSLYTVFLAALIALFFGLGVSAFYPSPKEPKFPESLEFSEPQKDGSESSELRETRQKYEVDSKKHQEEVRIYSRNVSIIMLVFAILSLALALILVAKILIISDALLLGGIFTLFYSIIRALLQRTRFSDF